MRICLSCHSPDGVFGRALEACYADAEVFFAPQSLRVGKFFVPQFCTSLDEAYGFLLLLGKRTVRWRLLESYEALDRHVTDGGFPLVPVITADKVQRRNNRGKSVRRLNIALNTPLIRRYALVREVQKMILVLRATANQFQKTHLHTTSKTHGRTAWHI